MYTEIIKTKEEFERIDKQIESEYVKDLNENEISQKYGEFLRHLVCYGYHIPNKERTSDNFLTRNPEMGFLVMIDYLKKYKYFDRFLLHFVTRENLIKIMEKRNEIGYLTNTDTAYGFSISLNKHPHAVHLLDHKIKSVAKRFLYASTFNEELLDTYIKYGIIKEESYKYLDEEQKQIFNMLISTAFGKVNCTAGLFWVNLNTFIDIYGFNYVSKPLKVVFESFDTYTLNTIILDLRVSLYRRIIGEEVHKNIREIFEYLFDGIASKHVRTIKSFMDLLICDWRMKEPFENIGYDLIGHANEYFKKNRKTRRILMELKLK